MKMKTQDTQTYRMQWKQYTEEIPSYKWLYFLKKERSQSSNLTIYLKELEKEEQTKLNTSRRKEIMKIIVKIKQRIKIPKSLFFEKIHQTDRSLDLIFSLQLKLILLLKKKIIYFCCAGPSLWHMSIVAPWHVVSEFPNQGSNLCPLHREADSYHQTTGSP